MNKTVRFSICLMLVAGSYMVTNVSAGEVVDQYDAPQRAGAITNFLGNMVHPEAPAGNAVGVPQSGEMNHAPHGSPTNVPQGVPFMGHQQGSPTGAPHGAPMMAPHGAPAVPFTAPNGAPLNGISPCDNKGVPTVN
jgi:hypothetical protein|tara:strand:+ start:484 stop:891 length:408 start_codon:yes stop_codon:yes gene_type:complete